MIYLWPGINLQPNQSEQNEEILQLPRTSLLENEGTIKRAQYQPAQDVPGLLQSTPNVHVLIYQVIGLPLGLVALDMGSDGNLLFFMNSYLDTIRTQNTRVLPNNNFTVQHKNSSSSIETGSEQREVAWRLEGLFIGSCLIIGFSLLSLILENPAKTLIRSVRTSALMRSKEMNAKDLPVPIGNVVCIQWTLILLFVQKH